MRNSNWLSTHAEPCLFWVLVAVYLIPIWAFRYFPTQDGPVHLSSSIILKDYGTQGTRYHEFFEMRPEPLPNWTAHLLLAGFMFVVPPLIAEKLLLSIYVLAFAGSLRYFCGAFGPNTRPCALVGLLFIYNRGVWLGFYNWDLSLVLALFVFGFGFGGAIAPIFFMAAALALLLMLTFFTHLVGFLIAALGLFWFALTSPRNRWLNLGWAALAILPAGLLTVDYFDRTGFFDSGAPNRMWHPWTWNRIVQDLTMLDREYFAQHIQGFLPMGLITLGLYGMLTAATFFAGNTPVEKTAISNPKWPAAVLAFGFLVMYVVATDDLGEHGSFIKTRLAMLPPLLLLGSLAVPGIPAVRLVLGTLVVFILTANLGFVIERVEADNQEIAEYTAAKEVVGTGHTFFILQDTWRPIRPGEQEAANPLLHASQYYCLDGNLNLDNYQATVRYFPFRYRDGVTRGRGSFVSSRHEKNADVVLAWEMGMSPRIPASFQPIFSQGRLTVFAKSN